VDQPVLAGSENTSFEWLVSRTASYAGPGGRRLVQPDTRKDSVSSRLVAWFVLLLWSVVIVGCANTQPSYETVYLRNSATGQVVACGPYKSTETGAPPSAAERSCIDNYQRQGFVQVPVSE
jgi:hypothetical protein